MAVAEAGQECRSPTGAGRGIRLVHRALDLVDARALLDELSQERLKGVIRVIG